MPFCKVDNIKLYYDDYGVRDQVPLIFLHGWMTHDLWGPLINRLKDKRRIIALYFRGHGRSDKPQGKYSIEQFSEDLFLFMKNLDIEKAIIVGHSMGGMVGLRFTLNHQMMVDKLILIDTLARSIPTFARKLIINAIGKILKIIPYGLFVRIYVSGVRRKNYPRSEIKTIQGAILSTPKQVLKSCFYIKSEEFDVTSQLTNISMPTLIIYGSEDEIIMREQAICMKEYIPNAELVVIKGAGHLPMVEAPETISENIENFINP